MEVARHCSTAMDCWNQYQANLQPFTGVVGLVDPVCGHQQGRGFAPLAQAFGGHCSRSGADQLFPVPTRNSLRSNTPCRHDGFAREHRLHDKAR